MISTDLSKCPWHRKVALVGSVHRRESDFRGSPCLRAEVIHVQIGSRGRKEHLGKTLLLWHGVDEFRFLPPLTVDLFVRPILLLVNLIDGLGGRVIDVCSLRSLRDVHPLFVDELDEELAFMIWHGHVFLCHCKWFLLMTQFFAVPRVLFIISNVLLF